jgi:hypothetical protein
MDGRLVNKSIFYLGPCSSGRDHVEVPLLLACTGGTPALDRHSGTLGTGPRRPEVGRARSWLPARWTVAYAAAAVAAGGGRWGCCPCAGGLRVRAHSQRRGAVMWHPSEGAARARDGRKNEEESSMVSLEGATSGGLRWGF